MQINLTMLPKRYLLGGGVFLLLIVGLIIGAVHPYKHALGSPPALPDVEVLQVQQEDVPIYGACLQKFRPAFLLPSLSAVLIFARPSRF